MRKFVPSAIFSYFSFSMFHFLMEWGEGNSGLAAFHEYFGETPGGPAACRACRDVWTLAIID